MNAEPISDPLFQSSRLILSAGTLTNTTFVERVSAAQQAGFDAISLFPQQYLAARRSEYLSIAGMQKILVDHEVDLDEVDPLLDWFGPCATPSEMLMMEMAEDLGARSINAAIGVPGVVAVADYAAALARAEAHGGEVMVIGGASVESNAVIC